MNDNSMTSCVISYACVGCYLGVLDDDKNMYNIQMFFVY